MLFAVQSYYKESFHTYEHLKCNKSHNRGYWTI